MVNMRQKTDIKEIQALLQDFRQEIRILREFIATLEGQSGENEEKTREKFEKERQRQFEYYAKKIQEANKRELPV